LLTVGLGEWVRQTVDKLQKKLILKRQSVDNDVQLENFVGRGKGLTMVFFKTFEKKHTHGVAWLVSWVLMIAVGWGPQI
jgi:hypothetical protein